ncbi:hypothetical protein [Sphingomonas abietis]|uniref:TULIP family P47-like protein n=1 Tax=Sphingomonas abietis TaxID=3012344 RepID=A0ABY7NLD1_9SPHN|nr:hypothetical protein [Sphingomonas abietis]WBO21382.1 hypothetical protein PBT88_14460 [Sphingomonas abietis]
MLDTFGWDLVFATTLSAYDAAMQAGGHIPASFATATAAGTWGAWHLIGGAPSNRQLLRCTIASGTVTVDGAAVDIAGATATAMIMLAVGADGVIAPLGGAAVILDTYTLPSGMAEADVYPIVAALTDMLRAAVPGLAGAFGSVQLAPVTADDGAPLWLRPTAAAFASQPLPANDARGAIVAVLATTEGRSDAALQPAVDARLFDGAPADADRAIVIGTGLVTAQLIAPSLPAVVQGSTMADFAISPTGTVYNAATMTWGSFAFATAGDSTSVITPVIPQGNLQLTLNGATAHLSMSNVHFPYPDWPGPGDITVSLDAEQYADLGIVPRSDGALVLSQVGTAKRTTRVTVIPSETTQIYQIALNTALQVLFAVIGGALDQALGAAEGAAAESIEDGAEDSLVSSLSDSELEPLLGEHADAEEIEAAEEEAAEGAGDALAHAGQPAWLQSFKATIMANWYKILLKIIEKAVEIPASELTALGVALAKRDYDHLPTINTIAENASAAMTWVDGGAIACIDGKVDQALLFWAKHAPDSAPDPTTPSA